jgi:hypothetical protein
MLFHVHQYIPTVAVFAAVYASVVFIVIPKRFEKEDRPYYMAVASAVFALSCGIANSAHIASLHALQQK